MTTTQILERKFQYSEHGERGTITIALRQVGDNPRPYFSATVDGRDSYGGEFGGVAGKDEVARFPEIDPVVRVHLSDDRGVPMHAEANALYWLGMSRYQKYDRETLARHLRVTETEADEIHRYVSGPAGEHQPSEALRFMIASLGLYARWRAEADLAVLAIQGRC